jgi:hypothetical protein
MENNLYYPPTIEEFYVGFEYEIKIKDNWRKKSTTISDFSPISDYDGMSILEEDLISNIIRVKTLDQSDIESLGWVSDQYVPERNICLNFKKPNDWYLNYWFGQIPYVEISRDGYDTGCAMKIKNKSQLKFVMTCLGILE